MLPYRITNLTLPGRPLFGAHVIVDGKWMPATGPNNRVRRWKSREAAEAAMKKETTMPDVIEFREPSDADRINEITMAYLAGEVDDRSAALSFLAAIEFENPDMEDNVSDAISEIMAFDQFRESEAA